MRLVDVAVADMAGYSPGMSVDGLSERTKR
jgi:hypothetical protein